MRLLRALVPSLVLIACALSGATCQEVAETAGSGSGGGGGAAFAGIGAGAVAGVVLIVAVVVLLVRRRRSQDAEQHRGRAELPATNLTLNPMFGSIEGSTGADRGHPQSKPRSAWTGAAPTAGGSADPTPYEIVVGPGRRPTQWQRHSTSTGINGTGIHVPGGQGPSTRGSVYENTALYEQPASMGRWEHYDNTHYEQPVSPSSSSTGGGGGWNSSDYDVGGASKI